MFASMEQVLHVFAESLNKYPVITSYLRTAEYKETFSMRVYIKIKIKSLVEEAKLIRSEEQAILRRHKKWRAKAESRKGTVPPASFFGLKTHRQCDVRREARAAHLAYGFLRGREYRAMEGTTTRKAPDWKRVEHLVNKYGDGDARDRMQTFSAWKDAA